MIRTLPATWSLPRLRLPVPLPTALALGVIVAFTVRLILLAWHGDAWAYYNANLSDLYGDSQLGAVSYVYPPPFAQVLEPFRALPFGAFYAALTIANVAILTYFVGPAWAAILLVAGPPAIMDQMLNANINLLMGLGVIVAIRRPATWAALIVTKVTPVIGLAYHLARREWRGVAMAVGATVLIVAVSVALSPGAWADWWAFTASGAQSVPDQAAGQFIGPFVIRLPLAVGMAWYAGTSGKAWMLPIAIVIGMTLPLAPHWTLALAAIPLWKASRAVAHGTR